MDFGDDESNEKPLPRRSSKTRAKRSDADHQAYDEAVGPDPEEPKDYDRPQEAEAMMSEAALDEALGSMMDDDAAEYGGQKVELIARRGKGSVRAGPASCHCCWCW